MDLPVLHMGFSTEADVVLIRKRTRDLIGLIGFERQEQTRITTAVSEITRNAFQYAGSGDIEFRAEMRGGLSQLVVIVRDKGPGIADLDAALTGGSKSGSGRGLGLVSAQRLMDDFQVETDGSGTTVRMARRWPHGGPVPTLSMIGHMIEQLAGDPPANAADEINRLNRQLLLQTEELRSRQEELERLSQELQDTNCGVVALYAELDENAARLRRADELKSRFLSHMSHEFRTPLNSIRALSGLLLSQHDGPLGAEQEKQVRFICKAAEDLTDLVNDLLDLAKVEAGKTVITPFTFTVDSLFGTLRGMLRPLLAGDAVALVFEDATALPPLHTDEAKVSQILRNFISNAIKFTEHGEIRVWATAHAADGTVTICVRDTGVGIAAGDIELIFQEFGQASNRLQGRFKGTGLGLPLSRKLAELLGGRIDVASRPGEGSLFSVTIPTILPATQPGIGAGMPQVPPLGDSQVHDHPARLQRPAKVLLLDDEEVMRHVIHQMLSSGPFDLRTAANWTEAARCLADDVPDVMLLDLDMPVIDGFEVLRRLRSDSRLRSLPVIVVTSAILAPDDRLRLNDAMQIIDKSSLSTAGLQQAIAAAVMPARVIQK